MILFDTTTSSQKKNVRCPVDSMREAVFTVSPNRQYRGIFSPTTPATTGPVFTDAPNT